MIKKLLLILLIILVAAVIFSPFIARQVEKNFNKVRYPSPYQVSTYAQGFHDSLLVADLHADPLLWGRDLNEEWQQGHFDLPRMRKANVALQVFSIVSKSPKGQNFQQNPSDSDKLGYLAAAQHWPYKTWTSPLHRAMYQANRLQKLTQENDDLTLIRNLPDLDEWLKARKADPKKRAGLLAIEGAHALEGNLNNFNHLKTAGVRMIGLAHFFDNQFSGSAHGMEKGGLTAKGKELVEMAQKGGVLIDLAHASPKAIDDVIAISKKPLVVSHTGVKALCESPRNLSDKHIRDVARTGGLIAVAIFEEATCGTDVKQMVDAIDHIAKMVGVDYVALGLDLDGAVVSPIDVTGMPLITQELLKRGYSERDIGRISGKNFIRVLKQTLN
ncbi:MAG: dipeptidase [Gammaproteobacteria bacterium]|nr:dipeptidase [Gammaproteobacteria bacterium]